MSENKKTGTGIRRTCAIVRDLLPIYTEGMTSEGSNRFIEAHLSRCSECRGEAEGMRPAPFSGEISEVPLKYLRRTLLRRRLAFSLLAVGLVCVMLFTAYARLTKKHYLTYDEAVASFGGGNGELQMVFTGGVTGFEHSEEPAVDFGVRTVHHNVQAWYTLLDRMRGHGTEAGVTVKYVSGSRLGNKLGLRETEPFYYGFLDDPERNAFPEGIVTQQRDEGPFGLSAAICGGKVELRYSIAPSASLLPLLFPAAASAVAALMLAAAAVLLFAKKRAAAGFALRALLFPLSCIAGYLLANGFQLYSHTPGRDLVMSCILAAMIIAFALGFIALLPRRLAGGKADMDS